MTGLQKRTEGLTKNMLKPKTPVPTGKNCDEEIKKFPKVKPALSEKYKTKKYEREKAGGEFKDPNAENTFRCLSEHYHNIYGSKEGLNSGALTRNLLGKYNKGVDLLEKASKKVEIRPPRRGGLRQSNKHRTHGSAAGTDILGAALGTVTTFARGLNGGNNINRRGKKRTRRRR